MEQPKLPDGWFRTDEALPFYHELNKHDTIVGWDGFKYHIGYAEPYSIPKPGFSWFWNDDEEAEPVEWAWLPVRGE
jgi:hypothetical protein